MPPKYDGTDVQYHTIPTFSFLTGTTLHDVKVAYRRYNPPSGTTSKGYVLIPTCFGGRVNTTLTFTTAPNDALSSYTVIVAAMLGNGESSSPSNKQLFPEPGELHYEDVINAHYDLLTKGLGITELEAVIGFSMGGQQAYHWGVMYPDFVKRVVGICTSARTSPHNYAFLEGPIAAMTNSIDYIAWKQVKAKRARGEEVGPNLSEVRPKHGIAAFSRAYAAWLTSAAWFREGWYKRGAMGIEASSVEEWIVAGERDDEDWDADDLLILARMWQLGDIGKTVKKEVSALGCTGGDDAALEEALKSIKAKVLLLPNRTDQYFPPEDNEIEVKSLRDGKLAIIESVWGHVSGGGTNEQDTAFMNKHIAELLAR